MKHRPSWYFDRLTKYFNSNYGAFESDSVEWYVNPAPNKWRFKIPHLGLEFTLTCYDSGKIAEKQVRV